MLLWLNILAVRRQSVTEILKSHWAEFGRNYYSRHDYEAVDTAVADSLVSELRAKLSGLPGTTVGGLTIKSAEDFAYIDPVDGSTSERQGIRIGFEGGGRVVLRLSGTGTEGATLRVYLEAFEPDPQRHDLTPEAALSAIAAAVEELAEIAVRTGRNTPDVTT